MTLSCLSSGASRIVPFSGLRSKAKLRRFMFISYYRESNFPDRRQPSRIWALREWPGRDSNPHTFRYRLLKPARLLVTPPGRVRISFGAILIDHAGIA